MGGEEDAAASDPIKAVNVVMKPKSKGKAQHKKKFKGSGKGSQVWRNGFNLQMQQQMMMQQMMMMSGAGQWQSQQWNPRPKGKGKAGNFIGGQLKGTAKGQWVWGGAAVKGKGKRNNLLAGPTTKGKGKGIRLWGGATAKGTGKGKRLSGGATKESPADRAARRLLHYGPASIKKTRKVSVEAVTRMDEAAALAEQCFGHQPAKKQKTDSKDVAFAEEVLDKAPDNAQTCRSLQVFVEKKLQKGLPEAPDVCGPEALKINLEVHADLLGRLQALQSTSGWDARAKRALDIVAATKTALGAKFLAAAAKDVEKEKVQLEELLKGEGDDTLDACVEKRVAYMKEWMQREWLLWCSKVLNARDVSLTGEEVAARGQGKREMGYVDILEVLLSGEGSLSTPVATYVGVLTTAKPKA